MGNTFLDSAESLTGAVLYRRLGKPMFAENFQEHQGIKKLVLRRRPQGVPTSSIPH